MCADDGIQVIPKRLSTHGDLSTVSWKPGTSLKLARGEQRAKARAKWEHPPLTRSNHSDKRDSPQAAQHSLRTRMIHTATFCHPQASMVEVRLSPWKQRARY